MRLRLPIIILAYCLSLAAPQAAEQPFHVSFAGDRYEDGAWRTGVLITLDPGWKTYWRMPGEAGIPPEFTWTASVPAEIDVAFPTPARHADQSGETVGYDNAVLFPVTVRAAGATEVDVKLDLFFAVCKDICIPASAQAGITLGPLMKDAVGSAQVDEAVRQLPAQGTAIVAARLVSDGGKPQLLLTLNEKPEDIFVESKSSAYFRAPAFAADGREARLVIDNLKDTAKLGGQELHLTYRLGDRGFEQTVKLPQTLIPQQQGPIP